MPFIPHTEDETKRMLAAVGASKMADLFAEIPPHLFSQLPASIPAGMSEWEISQLLQSRANQIKQFKSFLGAGAYEHHIPAAVWDITQRGEFLTAYTPYQAEASQGTLQLLWEYQTMMASLTGLEISNASLYDGATAVAEAVLMAVRIQHHAKKDSYQRKKIWVAQTVHPYYRQVLRTYLTPQQIELCEIPFDPILKNTTLDSLNQLAQNESCLALVISQPNFFGRLEEVNALTDWAHEQDALMIGVVNPLAMAWLKPPGQWGKQGADLACGDGQPLGIPLSGGGPYFGFLCSRMRDVRQLPGRLVGRTTDEAGEVGYVLTLQAREQHIRRGKATSNICTNQGLLVTAATIYMSLVGPKGLKQVAQACYHNRELLQLLLQKIPGVQCAQGEHFHEMVVQLPKPVEEVLIKMQAAGINAGVNLEPYYSELKNSMLVCVTETKTEADLIEYAARLKHILAL